MVNAEIIPAVYLKIENKPGTLEHASRLLGERHINVKALSLETVGHVGYARFLTEKPAQSVTILRAMGIESFESDLVVATIPNKPGELALACGELAAAGINVEGVLCTPDGRLAFRTSDNQTTQMILSKL